MTRPQPDAGQTRRSTSAAAPAPAPPGSGARPVRRPLLRPLALALLVPLVVALVLTLFVWPAPRGLDLAVVGSPAAVQSVAAVLDGAQPGAYDLSAVPDLDAARQAVHDRDVVGALVLGEPVTALTASAGSPAVAQLVQGLARALPSSTPPVVEDVVPLPTGDPRGVVLTGGLLPLIIAGIALGATAALQRVRARVRVLAVLVGAVASAHGGHGDAAAGVRGPVGRGGV